MSDEDYTKQGYAVEQVAEPADPDTVLATATVKVEVLTEGMYHMTTKLEGDIPPQDVPFDSPEGRASVMANLLVETMKVVIRQQGSVEGVIEWLNRCQSDPLATALASALANPAGQGDQDAEAALDVPSVKLGS